MTKSNETPIDNLIKGAINIDLGDGCAIRLTEDGSKLVCTPYGGGKCGRIEVPVATFLRAVGFTIDSPLDEYKALGIVKFLFTFIGYIDFYRFRKIVEAIDEALQDPDSIGLYG